MPKAKAAEIAEAVKAEYGHTVAPTLMNLVKSKSNVKKAGRKKGAAPTMGWAAEWVESIKLARRLLQATGSVANAVAILKAVEG
jgi:ribosomal protein L23